jgi:hypothetical protein
MVPSSRTIDENVHCLPPVKALSGSVECKQFMGPVVVVHEYRWIAKPCQHQLPDC